MIYRSRYPEVEIPHAPFPTVALRHAGRLASKPALIDASSGRALTFGELASQVERVAAGLYQHGVRQRDVVAIYAPNSIDYAVTFYAITAIGAVVAPANSMLTPTELRHQLERQSARFLFTTPELLDAATAAFPAGTVFVFGKHPTLTTFADLLSCEGDSPAVTIDPKHDLAALLSSSGTTGLPKSVMLTHRALVSIGAIAIGSCEIREHDIVPGQLPFFHSMGVLVTLATCPMVGATSVLLPRSDFQSFLRLIQDYRANRACIAAPVVVQLAKNPLVDDYDLSSLKAIISGAAPLGAEIQHEVSRRLGCVVKQGYGLTEALPIHIAPDDLPRDKYGSVGILMANTEARIVDPVSGTDVATGERGEILVRGPGMMAGYLNDPEATAATLDADGWLHTGDLGYVDEDGYFYIVDRLKELIKYKGYQVAPAELEALLLTHPAIADAAVVRFPDEDAGEIPKAFVVVRAPIDGDELMTWVAERVAPYKKIRMVEFIDVIPKSTSGKILRRELIARDQELVATA